MGLMTSMPANIRREDLRDVLSIGQLSRRYNLTLRTIRFYESRGLINPIRVGTTRYFNPACCHKIELIQRGKRLGMTLTEIESALAGDAEIETAFARMPADEVERRIHELEQQRSGLDGAIGDLYDILAKSRSQRSPSTTDATETPTGQPIRLVSYGKS